MASVNLSIKYRPVKIGFLVRDGSIEDLVKSVGINTLLWGGIYNPIIPVSTDSKFAEQLMNLFSVDVLFPVSHTKEIYDLTQKYPFLKDPGHYAENIFYEDWHTKKNIIGYLDSVNIVNYYWEKEFKHKPKSYQSNCVLVRWGDNDDLKNLFSIMFGYFPKEYNLRDDFENAFLKGLRSREIKISTTDSVSKNLAENISPIKLTALELNGYGGTWRGNGIYIGNENDFYDLLNFWNLRASGLFIEFLPKNKIERFKEFIKASIEKLDNTPNRNPNIEDWINIYYHVSHDEIKNVAKEFQSKKRFVFNEIIWNGLNIKPADFYFEWNHVLASVDKSYDRYVVSVSLPEKKFIANKDRDFGWQHLAVSINPIGEFGYPEHTLKQPFIRQLNEFYSRELAVDPWLLRIEKGGISALIKSNDSSLSLYPISHQVLIQKIFELAGIKSEISQAGLITKRIIEKLGGVDGGRVFKINGVRKLLQALKIDECISRGKGTNIIRENEEFKKYEKLYIEARETPKLTTHSVFDFLLKKDFLRAGLELVCNHCKLSNWLSLKEIDDIWTCNYCGNDNKTSLQLKNRGDWKFRKSGLFAKNNNQEGAIPVILTLLVFLRIFDPSKFIYSPSLKLKNGDISCEIDFCILQYQRRDKIQLAIGECKSEGGIIDQKDVDNLKIVRDKIKKLNIDCYLVFSKVSEKFEQSEIDLFKKLKEENIPIILLTNKELEPYHPYWEVEKANNLPEKYALDMAGMARNSDYLYLRD
ncbi:MAG: hypothetical protein GYA14_02200 [Ignavibacteria bacterium]|nr:hypothetical protein [Ignavibacteria bacterium]